jgi:TonB-linked SusC/RagA family outer membrane protein
MGNYYKFLCIGLALLASELALGQGKTVSGKVISAEDQQPVPGVNVVIPGTNRGTVTDTEGRYIISLGDKDNTLVFSFIGYATQTIVVGSQTTVDVTLELDSESLDEIVVIGYGTVKKSDLTGAVGSVKSDDLVKVVSSNPLQSLQGKIAGLQVINSSGTPGSAPIVRVRGVGTFNNNNPIYVVDGVILDDISFLNSSDIQSMELLKDASATAIYGNRGSNGVFIVTTKQGKVAGDGKVVVNFSGEYSVQRLLKEIDLLNGRQFGEVVNKFKPGEYNNLDALPNTDWQDLIFRVAPIQNYQMSFAGGSERNQYYFSVGYFKQEGIIEKSSYERLTLRLNNAYNIKDWLKMGNNLSFAPYKQQNTSGGAPFVVYRAQPTIEPYLASPSGDTIYSVVPGVGNVLADIENTNSYNRGIRSVGSFFAEATIKNDFRFRTSLGLDLSYNESESFTPAFYVSPQQQNALNDLTNGSSTFSSWLWENTLTYSKEIGKHRFDALGGFTTQQLRNENTSRTATDLARTDPNFWYINGNTVVPSSVNDGVDPSNYFSMLSFLGRVNYTLDDKYLFTATFRRDGSSKFLVDNRWGNFPSVAAGWNIINEDFMSSAPVLSNLKFRASWGITGNDKISYLDAYSTIGYANAVFGAPQQSQFVGLTFSRLGNPDLRWELAKQTDIGLEFGFLEDKLTGELDYYHRNTEDILVGLRVPGYVGYGDQSVVYNAGSMLNQGVELSLAWTDEIGKFNYKVSGNLTTIHNEVTKITGTGTSDDELLAFYNGQTITRSRVGDPIGSFAGYLTDGIFQNQAELDAYPHRSDAQPGDIRYVDVNKDGSISADDITNLGSPIPTLMYGFSLEGGYGSFRLSLDFAGQAGNKIYNAKETVRPDLYNYEAHVFGYWRGEGTSNSEPRPTAGGSNFLLSERFLFKGDFLRLRSLTLAYSIPKSVAQKAFLSKADVFLRGNNVFTSSKFPGYSPEAAGGSPLFNNIDTSVYPVASSYSLGLNLTF